MPFWEAVTANSPILQCLNWRSKRSCIRQAGAGSACKTGLGSNGICGRLASKLISRRSASQYMKPTIVVRHVSNDYNKSRSTAQVSPSKVPRKPREQSWQKLDGLGPHTESPLVHISQETWQLMHGGAKRKGGAQYTKCHFSFILFQEGTR
ncbi:hypothetical protein CFP56_015343 [Quercus suber]|uniref:Uncharacterized protein n=1 Tax=Quercus suber TaxID=58331 RepID=A0AAW0KPN6_QUESU